ncbi:pilus assembly protein TadG-related protein [Thermoactinospora rubra]|uniref:pilus assembly protein TadG-related protein n=1 Tax=Thermoactinospora rubra TaxID=1088767 RepID=UPI000A11F881|nr:pilus assembly protein TadG-related protein [Thermoactinospora rubra]
MRAAPRPDRGSTSVFVVVFSLAIFLLAGLLVDGGAAMNARLRAGDIAEQGARAAADTIDEDHLRETGTIRIRDEGRACARARRVVTAHAEAKATMKSCAVRNGNRVDVTVEIRWTAFFLSVIGIDQGTMAAEVTAGPETGVG